MIMLCKKHIYLFCISNIQTGQTDLRVTNIWEESRCYPSFNGPDTSKTSLKNIPVQDSREVSRVSNLSLNNIHN